MENLVSFGKYLLSDQREKMLLGGNKSVPYSERKKEVYHADVENWKHKNNI